MNYRIIKILLVVKNSDLNHSLPILMILKYITKNSNLILSTAMIKRILNTAIKHLSIHRVNKLVYPSVLSEI